MPSETASPHKIPSKINTKRATGRRNLTFKSLDDVLADLDAIEVKQLSVLGNWSVGQILLHLSVPMNGAIDGIEFVLPWHIRLAARMFKPLLLRMKMPPGFKLPPKALELLVPGPTSDEVGFASLRQAITRMKSDQRRKPHPVLGPLSVEEWEKMMCRHCELHLSFICLTD